MSKKVFNRICILSAAGILAAFVIFAIVRRKKTLVYEPIVIGQAVIDVIDINAVAVTPEPTAAPIVPRDAVTLLVGRRPVLSLASEPEAQKLLWEYLQSCAVAPEGEKFVSARFAQEIIIGPVDGSATIIGFDEAAAQLKNTPSLVPVLVTTQRVETATADVTVTSDEAKALSKGTRIVRQVGAGAVTQSSATVEYIAGVEARASEPVVTTVSPARATLIETGAYTKKDTSGEPGKGEGERGKDARSLTLQYPMRGSVKLRFGYCEGVMHNGLDIENSAGTKIVAPGEGVVIYCAERGAYGYTVDIDHGNGFVSRLTHLQQSTVELNQRVFAGEEIGVLAPLTDSRDKPHLHYELIIDNIPYNPEFYLA